MAAASGKADSGPKRGVMLEWDNLELKVKDKTILSGVTGKAAPGTLTLIMGPSGAGKTTLMNMLAQRAEQTSGSIRMNGKEPSYKSRRVMGYVEQEVAQFEILTVRETLYTTARLKLPDSVGAAEVSAKVDEIIKKLDIVKATDTRISGCSGGEKRRLAVAAELLGEPSLLFLDEPTSGLDANASLNLLSILRRLARVENRTIICTIHQPRASLLTFADQLILLANGRQCYAGPTFTMGSLDGMLSYFDALGFPCSDVENPADHVVDLVNLKTAKDIAKAEEEGEAGSASAPASASGEVELAAAGASSSTAPPSATAEIIVGGSAAPHSSLPDCRGWEEGSHAARLAVMPPEDRKEAAAAVRDGKSREEFVSWLADQFDRSLLARGLAAPVASMPPPPAVLLDDTTLSRYPTAICTQTCVVLRRVFLFKMREPEAMATQFFNLVINPIMFGAIYWQMPLTLTGVSDRFGFISLLFLMNAFAAIDALTLFPKERQVFLRDTNANLYGTLAYYVGRTVAELPSLVIFSVLGSLVAIYMAGLNQEIDRVGVFILANTLMTVTGASLLIFVSSLGRTMAEANAVGVVVLMLAMMFNGFFIQEENTPDVFKWISRISFLHFGLKVGMRNELEGLTIVCQPQEIGCSTDGASYLTTGSGEDEMWAAVGFLFLTNGILRVLTFFTLHFLFTGQTWAVRARQLCEW